MTIETLPTDVTPGDLGQLVSLLSECVEGGSRELYEALGYLHAGGIPGYALDPHGTPEKNAIFYRELK